jgi:transcriptional regulator with XRE-family HTH domain
MGSTLGERLRKARKDRGISLHKLSHAMYDPEADTNYDASFIGRVERGEKIAPARLLKAYGAIVEPSIEEVPEYYLARARLLLDDREVGLEHALANLIAITEALDLAGVPEEGLGELAGEELRAFAADVRTAGSDPGAPGEGGHREVA